jgi:hypothetical protein
MPALRDILLDIKDAEGQPAFPAKTWGIGNVLSAWGELSCGRHCHSTLSLTVIACHSLGIYPVSLLSWQSFSAEMKVSPTARQARRRTN